MAELYCAICGKKLGGLSPKWTLADGAICLKCGKAAGLESSAMKYQNVTSEGMRAMLSGRAQTETNTFSPSKKVRSCLQVDENNKLFKVGKDVFRYSNLLGFELLEDEQTITKGGLGRAVTGAVLFGGVGAVVGGVTGGKKSKGVCSSMKIRLTLKDAYTDTVYIEFINHDTKTKSALYKMAQEAAQSCLSALHIISDFNQSEKAATGSPSASPGSAADEILKYKQLLDAEAITQEEFEAKKKQLLGL